MIPLRGLCVCVGDYYARTLSVCLPRNRKHFAEFLVVTAPGDPAAKIAWDNDACFVETDAFTRPGVDGVRPHFNKSLAIEESFDILGRHGWIAVIDADILLPDVFPWQSIQPGRLHGCRRRILENPDDWRPDLEWRTCRRGADNAPIGYFQLFHADDLAIRDKRPWYDVTYRHAGGGDAAFLEHWPKSKHAMLPMEALHLGPISRHWFGTDDESKRLMDAYIVQYDWNRYTARVDRRAIADIGPIEERIRVPGYPESSFDLRFVARAKARGKVRSV